MSRTPCRFYDSPGGCRRGSSCTFSHIRNTERRGVDGRPSSPSVASDGSPSRRNAQYPQRPTSPSSPLPRGVCRFFWESGRCNREFDCRYQHTLGPRQGQVRQDGTQSPQPLRIPTQAAQQFIAPFLTERGLAKLVGSGTDGYFPLDTMTSMTPTETHGHLRRFLRDQFRFKTTHEIYGFLIPLSSANNQNNSWTQEEGQLLLETLTSNIGRLRIAEIVTWPQISPRAVMSREVLSFQRGLIPLLRYMSSDFVVQSTLRTQANQLYMTVLQNLPDFADAVEKSMNTIIDSRSFNDPGAVGKDLIDPQAFASIAGILHEFLVRFKNAVATYPRLAPLVMNLQKWFGEWKTGISTNPPSFESALKTLQPTVRDMLVQTLNEKINKLVSIVEREQGKEQRSDSQKQRSAHATSSNEGILAALESTYEGPGAIHEGGPRHDNDFVDIYDIRIAPTHEELMSRVPPFLPVNFFGAPHPAPPGSMQRLLDIQFRLLREELTAPLRKAVQLVHDDLTAPQRKKTKLSELLKSKGGKYRGQADMQDSLMFNVYTGVEFRSLVPDWKGISSSIIIDTPPGRARSNNAHMRASFWEGMSGKRLFQGGLIALVWQSGKNVAVHLGVIANSAKELTDHAKRDPDSVKLRIVFFDTKLELRILQELKNTQSSEEDLKLLVESPVMFEAIRPFLEALKVEPELVPFSRYLAHQPPGFLETCTIDPPRYATMPGFEFKLSCLFPDDAEVGDLTLSVTDPRSIDNARAELRRNSRLDPSQADAVVDALTRELSLIQGPPGTGKSFTGVELLRVLRANDIGPILMIAFTNHALGHMLGSVLDAGITKKVIRLGSRSADERISQYSIETLEMVDGESRLNRTFSGIRRELKNIQESIRKLMEKVLKQDLESDSTQVMKYLSTFHPEHHGYLDTPPSWIWNIKTIFGDDDDDAGEWQQQGRRGKAFAKDMSFYAFWRDGSDLDFIGALSDGSYAPWRPATPPVETTNNKFGVLEQDPSPESDDEYATGEDNDDDDSLPEDVQVEDAWMLVKTKPPPPEPADPEEAPVPPSRRTPSSLEPEPRNDAGLSQADFKDLDGFLAEIGCSQLPIVATSNRPLEELLEDVGDVWTMSREERYILHNFWVDQTRIELAESQKGEFERLRELHEHTLRECNEGKEEVRRNLLRNIDIIGCTTTGAAKLATLLKGLSPRVLLVEEAGQVLEAHVLGSLVDSIQHLILIGDPLQLRPTLNNYSLSMDSKRGKDLYRFDMSLMERLSSSGLAMSRIDVQRRMRPSISSLIRNTLYPGLEDHELVHHYPPVRGIPKNVFFVTHNHRENEGAEDSASKYNLYEVAMIRELVLYLLRQGCYSEEGDIVVLCAYLGQLARLRDALANEVAIVIDERDQAALADQEGDDESDFASGATIEHVRVTKRVRLRTVDNYQGEEGRIVILSLVRNSGEIDDEAAMLGFTQGTRPSIGFLRSENRTNVALSRAREGLFIFGNAANLSSRSHMWQHIIEELETNEALGPALPIACHLHPEALEYVSAPGQLPQIAPDGGCMRPCDFRLNCGHMCPFKCHSDDQKHASVTCTQTCTRLCTRGHPCTKQCASSCGDCFFPVGNVELPCGHLKASVPCYQIGALENVFCDFVVNKDLPSCEHTAHMTCSTDPSTYLCKVPCGGIMGCCGRTCKAKCYECQQKNPTSEGGHTQRVQHLPHPCQKPLFCEHLCQEPCSDDHKHTVSCKKPCRQACSHARCQLPCSAPCAPCQEPCTWSCPHRSCPVPCGSVCARLPCDVPCEKILRCGHMCPSVCGEDCRVQLCPQCASDDKKNHVVDFIMQRTLSEVTPELGTLDEMTITIPSCGHTFTIETLDGHCGMSDFYRQKELDGQWLGLLCPVGFRKPPACPTCRSPITAPRYGRIFKRGDLDILEQNVAARMSQALDKVQTTILRISEGDMKALVIDSAAAIKIRPSKNPKPNKMQAKARSKELKEKQDVPISEHVLNSANTALHVIDSAVTQAWGRITHRLFNAYREAAAVASTRSAHMHAWESAFSFLYQHELSALVNNPTRVPVRPQENAMRLAKLQVGQSRPLADRRFVVEAFWCTLHIRLTLVTLGRTWLEEVGKREADYPQYHFQQWANYINFILGSCTRDVDKALELARSSESHRQVTKTSLLCMRVELERFRFSFYMSNKTGAIKNIRSELVEKAEKCGREALQTMEDVIAEHLTNKPGEEVSWLEENFTRAAHTIVDEWTTIKDAIRRGSTFYQEVSLEEQMEIVRAFNFGSTGHFYNCANGHTFVIGEVIPLKCRVCRSANPDPQCGGAMERSVCPECGSPVGGQSHQLDGTNTRASDFDNIARQMRNGIAESPWANPY